jgi:hypothetical protein
VTGKGFLPGQSGNPHGRPRSERKLIETKFGEDGERLYEELDRLLKEKATPKRLRARIAMFLIERLHGKAQQSVELRTPPISLGRLLAGDFSDEVDRP